MARKVQVVLEDDIDGSPAAETVSFSIDGRSYEIDLSADNAAALRAAFGTWVANARLADGGRAKKPVAKSPVAKRSSRDVREWAKANGIQVSERGRIAADVIAKFQAANG